MIEEKELDELVADKIGEYVQLSGNIELVDALLQNDHLNKVPSAVKGLEATKLLLTYCNILGLEKEIIFDLSLARGLDYYTGVIYEAVLKGIQFKLNELQFIGIHINLLFEYQVNLLATFPQHPKKVQPLDQSQAVAVTIISLECLTHEIDQSHALAFQLVSSVYFQCLKLN